LERHVFYSKSIWEDTLLKNYRFKTKTYLSVAFFVAVIYGHLLVYNCCANNKLLRMCAYKYINFYIFLCYSFIGVGTRVRRAYSKRYDTRGKGCFPALCRQQFGKLQSIWILFTIDFRSLCFCFVRFSFDTEPTALTAGV